MKIEVTGPMVAAHRKGIGSYTPVVDGVELEPECNSLAATNRNLDKLLAIPPKGSAQKWRRKVVSLYAAARQVIVVFDDGSSYLATGFYFFGGEAEVDGLAAFAEKNGFGRKAELVNYYTSLSHDFVGTLTLDPEWDKPHPSDERAVISLYDDGACSLRRD